MHVKCVLHKNMFKCVNIHAPNIVHISRKCAENGVWNVRTIGGLWNVGGDKERVAGYYPADNNRLIGNQTLSSTLLCAACECEPEQSGTDS